MTVKECNYCHKKKPLESFPIITKEVQLGLRKMFRRNYECGRPISMSNFGCSIGYRGLLAPGINLTSTLPRGKFGNMSGTSVLAPIVTGTIALLWSIFTNATAAQIIHSVRSNTGGSHRSIIPPLVNAELAFNRLKAYSQQ